MDFRDIRLAAQSNVCLPCLIAALCFLLVSTPARAVSIPPISLDQMIAYAEHIVEARVVAVRTRREAGTDRIWSDVELEVLDTIQGGDRERRILLSFLGGTLGDDSTAVLGGFIPELGEHGIYFIAGEGGRANPLVGWHQGHMLIKRDFNGGVGLYTPDLKPITGVAVEEDAVPPYSPAVTSLGLMQTGEDDDNKAMTPTELKMLIRQNREMTAF